MSNIINVVLDATMLDTFMSCECKFNYRFNLNKIPVGSAKPLERGTVIHSGFEHYFKSLQNRVTFNDSLASGIDAMKKDAVLTDLTVEEVDLYIKSFTESCNYYRSRDEQMEILAVEQAFQYLLHEDEVMRLYMIGKIDLLVNEPGYNNLPYDHKSYERTYPTDKKAVQFCNYAYATGSNYLMVNKVGLQKTLSIEQKHKRIPLSYDPLFMEEWKDDMVNRAYQYLECVTTNKWPRNVTSCMKYNRPCEYTEVCDSSGIEAKVYKLEANFNVSPIWDVSKSLGERK